MTCGDCGTLDTSQWTELAKIERSVEELAQTTFHVNIVILHVNRPRRKSGFKLAAIIGVKSVERNAEKAISEPCNSESTVGLKQLRNSCDSGILIGQQIVDLNNRTSERALFCVDLGFRGHRMREFSHKIESVKASCDHVPHEKVVREMCVFVVEKRPEILNCNEACLWLE